MPYRKPNSPFWHYDFQIRGSRFHGSCGTADFEEAKAVEAAARVEAKASLSKAPEGVFTLSEALGTYFADVSAHQKSARTTKAHMKAILDGIPAATKLPDLTMARVQKYVTKRRATCANGTVNRELQTLARALRHMQKIHNAKVAELDMKGLETKEAEERIRELTMAEQGRLFEKLRPDLHPLVALALMTGLRLSELCGLKWKAVDYDTGRIRFVQKGQKTRYFPINAELRAFLSSLPRANSLPHGAYVLTYVNQKTAERTKYTQGGGIMEVFRAALAEADIDDFRFHDLRHTFATRLLRKTGNLKLVSRLLGHSEIETTMRYAHVLDEDMRDGLDGYTVFGSVPNEVPNSRASD